MAENLGKWPSNRGPIAKLKPSDGCKGDAVPFAADWWYDFTEFGCHLGNVGEKLVPEPGPAGFWSRLAPFKVVVKMGK